MAATRVGWLTLHEVLDRTGLPYRDLMELVEAGQLVCRRTGAAELYDPDDVDRLARTPSLD